MLALDGFAFFVKSEEALNSLLNGIDSSKSSTASMGTSDSSKSNAISTPSPSPIHFISLSNIIKIKLNGKMDDSIYCKGEVSKIPTTAVNGASSSDASSNGNGEQKLNNSTTEIVLIADSSKYEPLSKGDGKEYVEFQVIDIVIDLTPKNESIVITGKDIKTNEQKEYLIAQVGGLFGSTLKPSYQYHSHYAEGRLLFEAIVRIARVLHNMDMYARWISFEDGIVSVSNILFAVEQTSFNTAYPVNTAYIEQNNTVIASFLSGYKNADGVEVGTQFGTNLLSSSSTHHLKLPFIAKPKQKGKKADLNSSLIVEDSDDDGDDEGSEFDQPQQPTTLYARSYPLDDEKIIDEVAKYCDRVFNNTSSTANGENKLSRREKAPVTEASWRTLFLPHPLPPRPCYSWNSSKYHFPPESLASALGSYQTIMAFNEFIDIEPFGLDAFLEALNFRSTNEHQVSQVAPLYNEVCVRLCEFLLDQPDNYNLARDLLGGRGKSYHDPAGLKTIVSAGATKRLNSITWPEVFIQIVAHMEKLVLEPTAAGVDFEGLFGCQQVLAEMAENPLFNSFSSKLAALSNEVDDTIMDDEAHNGQEDGDENDEENEASQSKKVKVVAKPTKKKSTRSDPQQPPSSTTPTPSVPGAEESSAVPSASNTPVPTVQLDDQMTFSKIKRRLASGFYSKQAIEKAKKVCEDVFDKLKNAVQHFESNEYPLKEQTTWPLRYACDSYSLVESLSKSVRPSEQGIGPVKRLYRKARILLEVAERAAAVENNRGFRNTTKLIRRKAALARLYSKGEYESDNAQERDAILSLTKEAFANLISIHYAFPVYVEFPANITGQLGMIIGSRQSKQIDFAIKTQFPIDSMFRIEVKGFDNQMSVNPARDLGKIRPGDLIVAVNGVLTAGMNEEKVISLIKTSPKPLKLIFGRILPKSSRGEGFHLTSNLLPNNINPSVLPVSIQEVHQQWTIEDQALLEKDSQSKVKEHEMIKGALTTALDILSWCDKKQEYSEELYISDDKGELEQFQTWFNETHDALNQEEATITQEDDALNFIPESNRPASGNPEAISAPIPTDDLLICPMCGKNFLSAGGRAYHVENKVCKAPKTRAGNFGGRRGGANAADKAADTVTPTVAVVSGGFNRPLYYETPTIFDERDDAPGRGNCHEGFASDVRSIFKNAMQLQIAGSELSDFVDILENVFEEAYERLVLQKVSKLEDEVPEKSLYCHHFETEKSDLSKELNQIDSQNFSIRGDNIQLTPANVVSLLKRFDISAIPPRVRTWIIEWLIDKLLHTSRIGAAIYREQFFFGGGGGGGSSSNTSSKQSGSSTPIPPNSESANDKKKGAAIYDDEGGSKKGQAGLSHALALSSEDALSRLQEQLYNEPLVCLQSKNTRFLTRLDAALSQVPPPISDLDMLDFTEVMLGGNSPLGPTIRLDPLGNDRFHARYWWHEGDTKGRIWVEGGLWSVYGDSKMVQTLLGSYPECFGLSLSPHVQKALIRKCRSKGGNPNYPPLWGYISTKEELDNLILSLNPLGRMENSLLQNLKRHYMRIVARMHPEMDLFAFEAAQKPEFDVFFLPPDKNAKSKSFKRGRPPGRPKAKPEAVSKKKLETPKSKKPVTPASKKQKKSADTEAEAPSTAASKKSSAKTPLSSTRSSKSQKGKASLQEINDSSEEDVDSEFDEETEEETEEEEDDDEVTDDDESFDEEEEEEEEDDDDDDEADSRTSSVGSNEDIDDEWKEVINVVDTVPHPDSLLSTGSSIGRRAIYSKISKYAHVCFPKLSERRCRKIIEVCIAWAQELPVTTSSALIDYKVSGLQYHNNLGRSKDLSKVLNDFRITSKHLSTRGPSFIRTMSFLGLSPSSMISNDDALILELFDFESRLWCTGKSLRFMPHSWPWPKYRTTWINNLRQILHGKSNGKIVEGFIGVDGEYNVNAMDVDDGSQKIVAYLDPEAQFGKNWETVDNLIREHLVKGAHKVPVPPVPERLKLIADSMLKFEEYVVRSILSFTATKGVLRNDWIYRRTAWIQSVKEALTSAQLAILLRRLELESIDWDELHASVAALERAAPIPFFAALASGKAQKKDSSSDSQHHGSSQTASSGDALALDIARSTSIMFASFGLTMSSLKNEKDPVKRQSLIDYAARNASFKLNAAARTYAQAVAQANASILAVRRAALKSVKIKGPTYYIGLGILPDKCLRGPTEEEARALSPIELLLWGMEIIDLIGNDEAVYTFGLVALEIFDSQKLFDRVDPSNSRSRSDGYEILPFAEPLAPAGLLPSTTGALIVSQPDTPVADSSQITSSTSATQPTSSQEMEIVESEQVAISSLEPSPTLESDANGSIVVKTEEPSSEGIVVKKESTPNPRRRVSSRPKKPVAGRDPERLSSAAAGNRFPQLLYHQQQQLRGKKDKRFSSSLITQKGRPSIVAIATKTVIKALNLRQRDIALEETGVSQSNMSLWLNGKLPGFPTFELRMIAWLRALNREYQFILPDGKDNYRIGFSTGEESSLSTSQNNITMEEDNQNLNETQDDDPDDATVDEPLQRNANTSLSGMFENAVQVNRGSLLKDDERARRICGEALKDLLPSGSAIRSGSEKAEKEKAEIFYEDDITVEEQERFDAVVEFQVDVAGRALDHSRRKAQEQLETSLAISELHAIGEALAANQGSSSSSSAKQGATGVRTMAQILNPKVERSTLPVIDTNLWVSSFPCSVRAWIHNSGLQNFKPGDQIIYFGEGHGYAQTHTLRKICEEFIGRSDEKCRVYGPHDTALKEIAEPLPCKVLNISFHGNLSSQDSLIQNNYCVLDLEVVTSSAAVALAAQALTQTKSGSKQKASGSSGGSSKQTLNDAKISLNDIPPCLASLPLASASSGTASSHRPQLLPPNTTAITAAGGGAVALAHPRTIAFLILVMQNLSRMEDIAVLWQPISKEKYPDYYEVTKNHVDVFIIEEKARKGLYQSEMDFLADFERLRLCLYHYFQELHSYGAILPQAADKAIQRVKLLLFHPERTRVPSSQRSQEVPAQFRVVIRPAYEHGFPVYIVSHQIAVDSQNQPWKLGQRVIKEKSSEWRESEHSSQNFKYLSKRGLIEGTIVGLRLPTQRYQFPWAGVVVQWDKDLPDVCLDLRLDAPDKAGMHCNFWEIQRD